VKKPPVRTLNVGTSGKIAKPLATIRIGRSPVLVELLKPNTQPARERRDRIDAAVRAVVSRPAD